MTVRGGIRQTFGTQGLLATPNAPTLIPGTVNYQATTYSAGATYRATDWLNTRFGASSGFRAPTATELGANFTVTPIGTTIFGNPSLQPETSQQLEVGSTFELGRRPPRPRTLPERDPQPHPVGDALVGRRRGRPAEPELAATSWMQGLEFQAEADVIRTLRLNSAAVLATGTSSATATTIST